MFWRRVEYIFCKLGCDLPWLQVRNQLQRVVLEEISQERDQLCPHQGYFRKGGRAREADQRCISKIGDI
jgi:hypothetical protein